MARFIASRRIVGWERGGDKPANEWDRAILDDGAFVAASDLPDAPSAANVGGWELGTLLAVQGKKDCIDVRCRRMFYPDEPHVRPGCMGWHCPDCDKPTSSMGHKCPERAEA